MADILIRGINKPESCGRCPFRDFGDDVFYDCVINKKLGIECTINSVKYYSICPLVELPEHGNLIDADSLADDLLYDAELADRVLSDMSLVGSEREYMQSEKDIKQNCAYYVSHAPVVIPSNKEDTP